MWFYKIIIPMITEICRDYDEESSISNLEVEEEISEMDALDSSFDNSSTHLNSPRKRIKADNGRSYVFSTVAVENILGIVASKGKEEIKNEVSKFSEYPIDKNCSILTKESGGNNPLYETYIKKLNKMLSGDYLVFTKIRNFICVDLRNPLERPYADLCKKNYSATLISLDKEKEEASLKKLNDIIQGTTLGCFQNVFQKLPVDRPLLVLNTMVFAGNWLKKFDPKDNCEDFFTTNKKQFKTTFMNIRAPFQMFTTENYRLLKMEFNNKSGNHCLVIVLPKEGDNPSSLLYDFNQDMVYEYFDKNLFYDIHLKIPKFRIETEVDLDNVCKDLELKNLTAENNNFCEEDEHPSGANMMHKAIIVFHEKGVGNTGSDFVMPLVPGEILGSEDFNCDRPFSFFIIYNGRKTKSAPSEIRKVFYGRYSGPNQ